MERSLFRTHGEEIFFISECIPEVGIYMWLEGSESFDKKSGEGDTTVRIHGLVAEIVGWSSVGEYLGEGRKSGVGNSIKHLAYRPLLPLSKTAASQERKNFNPLNANTIIMPYTT
jgi:hypothetical protein